MEKINVAELLCNCPRGMELDCTMYEDVCFDYVDELNIIHCYIQHEAHKTSITFNQHGTPNSDIKSKCVIFPKGEKTWEGFQKPFKNGDILINGLEDGEYNPFIFKQTNGYGNAQCYCAISCFGHLILNNDNWTYIKGCRLATEEEKAKLFKAIKDNGYVWNEETKSLEKLPKIKVNDRVKKKSIDDVDAVKIAKIIQSIHTFTNKFDITTLKPFQKVLVRDSDSDKEYWSINLFGFYNEISKQFHCMGNTNIGWDECIPYEGNEHLLGTTNDCDEYYKIWE